MTLPLRWKQSFGTASLFKGYSSIQGTQNSQMWSQKNVRIIIVSITSIEGIPGYSGKGTCFLGPRTPGYPPFRAHFSSQKVNILNSASRILQCWSYYVKINSARHQDDTERTQNRAVCSHRQLFRPLWGSSVWRNNQRKLWWKISAHSDLRKKKCLTIKRVHLTSLNVHLSQLWKLSQTKLCEVNI